MQNLVFWNLLQEFESGSFTSHLVWRSCGGQTYFIWQCQWKFAQCNRAKKFHSLILFMEINCRVVQVSMSVNVNMSVLLLLAASSLPQQTPKRWITKKEKPNTAICILDCWSALKPEALNSVPSHKLQEPLLRFPSESGICIAMDPQPLAYPILNLFGTDTQLRARI